MTAPVLAFKESPAGKPGVPTTLQETGAVPPLLCSVALYALPTTPVGKELVVTVREVVAEFTVMLSCCVAEPGPPVAVLASVTLTVKGVPAPAVVGVPEIVLPVNVRPVGNAPVLIE